MSAQKRAKNLKLRRIIPIVVIAVFLSPILYVLEGRKHGTWGLDNAFVVTGLIDLIWLASLILVGAR